MTSREELEPGSAAILHMADQIAAMTVEREPGPFDSWPAQVTVNLGVPEFRDTVVAALRAYASAQEEQSDNSGERLPSSDAAGVGAETAGGPHDADVLEYIDAWSSAIYDATGDQVKTDRAIQLAEVRGLFDPIFMGTPIAALALPPQVGQTQSEQAIRSAVEGTVMRYPYFTSREAETVADAVIQALALPPQAQEEKNDPRLELASKLDNSRWSKITHGVDVQLSYQEMDLARDVLRASAQQVNKLIGATVADIDKLFERDDLFTARCVFARLKNFGYDVRAKR